MLENAVRQEVLDTVPADRPVTPAALAEQVRGLDSTLDPSSTTFRAAVLLLAALQLGQNVDRLARFTGYPHPFVAKCARRLVDNGVWKGGKTVCDWYRDREDHRAFWNDVQVAEGKLCRRTNEHGEIEWASAGVWLKNYDYVEPRPHTDTNVLYHVRSVAGPSEPEPFGNATGVFDEWKPSTDGSTRHGSPRRKYAARPWKGARMLAAPAFRRRRVLRVPPPPPSVPVAVPVAVPVERIQFPELFPNANWLA